MEFIRNTALIRPDHGTPLSHEPLLESKAFPAVQIPVSCPIRNVCYACHLYGKEV
jgi:hypothetical protein